MNDCILKIENVNKTFHLGRNQKVQALSDICLSVPKGTIVGLVGANRAGKSTLLKIILGLIKADSGSVTRFDKPITNRSTLKYIGAVLESPVFPPYLSPTDILNTLGSLAGIHSEFLPSLISEALTKVGLDDRKTQRIAGFSRGMTQRLLIAQAILANPDLLILDEPFEGLDFEGKQKIFELLTDWRKHGRSVIIVSHELEDLENICDRVVMLARGRIIRDDSMESWRGNSHGPFLQKAMQDLERIT